MADLDPVYPKQGKQQHLSASPKPSFGGGTTIGNYASGDEYQAGDNKYYTDHYGSDVSKWPYQNPLNRRMEKE